MVEALAGPGRGDLRRHQQARGHASRRRGGRRHPRMTCAPWQAPGAPGRPRSNAAAAVCLMHMQGEPRTMQAERPRYGDVVTEVKAFLLERAQSCRAAGIARTGSSLDPGFGFGKTLAAQCCAPAGLDAFARHGLFRSLVGLSRKSMLAEDSWPPGRRAPLRQSRARRDGRNDKGRASCARTTWPPRSTRSRRWRRSSMDDSL